MFDSIVHRDFWSRLGAALRGAVLGLAVLLVSFPLLVWNEGRAVKRARDLSQGAGSVLAVSAERVDPTNQGRLVHLIGKAETDERLSDDAFGVTVAAIHLRRVAEMVQWVELAETRVDREAGGGEKRVTTYRYEKQWSERHIDSEDFHEPGHANPAALPHASRRWTARRVRVGAFQLSGGLVSQIRDYEPVTPPAPPEGAAWTRSGDTLYLPAGGEAGAPGDGPVVGDLRVRYEAAPPATVSIVARQTQERLGAWKGEAGSRVEELEMGAHSADRIFATLEGRSRLLSWLLRVLGLVLMGFGLSRLVAPVEVVGDVLPALGDLLRLGTGPFVRLLTLALGAVTIGCGWVAYRPLVGVPLLLAGAAALAWLVRAGRSRRAPSGPLGAASV